MFKKNLSQNFYKNFYCKFLLFSFFLFIFNASSNELRAENYNIFKPVPRNKMREMHSERPSKSDFVTTIDAGRFQLETALFNKVIDKECSNSNCIKTNSLGFFNQSNLRIGITKNSDLQIISDIFTQNKIVNNVGLVSKNKGFGDINLRYKYSFSGNNSEKFGIAIIPNLKLPTNQDNLGNKNFEGGVSVPYVLSLENGYLIGGMTQIQILKTAKFYNPTEHHSNFFYFNTFYLTKDFTKDLCGFVEYYISKNLAPNSWWQNTADFGLQYKLSKDIKIDGGVNLGLTNKAEDLNYYTGFAYRF